MEDAFFKSAFSHVRVIELLVRSQVPEWQGIRQGREQGMELGRVSVLRQLAARKFGQAVADELVRLIDRTQDPERVARATEALLDCDAAEDFLAKVQER